MYVGEYVSFLCYSYYDYNEKLFIELLFIILFFWWDFLSKKNILEAIYSDI